MDLTFPHTPGSSSGGGGGYGIGSAHDDIGVVGDVDAVQAVRGLIISVGNGTVDVEETLQARPL